MNTALHHSPFALLGISVRDNRLKIVEEAEEKSLLLDTDICTKARNDLTTLRNRLTAEIKWLPGVSPNRAAKILDDLSSNILSIIDIKLPSLASANVLVAAIETFGPKLEASKWSDSIIDLAYRVDLINPVDVLSEINTDRLLSGFAQIKDLDQIESELEAQREYYIDATKMALNKLPSMILVEVVTEVVEHTTESGEAHGPQFVHELVSRYEEEVANYLKLEADNIIKLVDAIKNNAQHGESAIKSQIDKLESLVTKWDSISQPIQLSNKVQGLSHNISSDVALKIRSLAVDLFNDHNMVPTVNRLTSTLQDLFAELPEILETLDRDVESISAILKDRQNSDHNKAQLAQEITYQAEIGILFKDTLKISPNGVEWKGRRIALSDISWVKWGAVRKSVNGIPSGTDHTIALGGPSVSDMIIVTAKSEIYNSFVDCLWRAVCIRILEQYLFELKNGKQLSIGNGVVFDDRGINLIKHKLFGNEIHYKEWGSVTYNSYNGSLFITASDDKKTYIELPYLSAPNAHILESIIRLSFKKWTGKLSGILEG